MQQDPMIIHSLYTPTPVASILFQNIQNTDNSPMNNGIFMARLSVFYDLIPNTQNEDKPIMFNGTNSMYLSVFCITNMALSVFCIYSFIVSLTNLYWKRSNGEKAVLSSTCNCNVYGVII